MQNTLIQTAPATTASGLTSSLPGRIAVALAATGLVAAASHVAIPLPFTPVPLTLQPLAVLAVGLTLGPVAAFGSMVAYLCEGALGLPVFAPTGLGGVAQLLGPTGGFLLAYPFVAAIAGGLNRGLNKVTPRFLAAVFACLAACIVLFTLGAARLMTFAHLSLHQAVTAAVVPFIPGTIFDVLAASGIYTAMAYRRR